MTSNGRVEQYADLAVRSWVNLAPGQELGVMALSLDHAPLARAIARAAYAANPTAQLPVSAFEKAPDEILT